MTIFNNTSNVNSHPFVDLGLPSGTLWATANIGASTTNTGGDLFAYGETFGKTSFDWDNYIYGHAANKSLVMMHYLPGNTSLKPTDDAATTLWGERWKTPSGAQFAELIDGCSWQYTREGLIGTSLSNGQRIFFPSAGYGNKDKRRARGWSGNYRTSNLHPTREDLSVAFNFNGGSLGLLSNCERFLGLSIRPVTSRN